VDTVFSGLSALVVEDVVDDGEAIRVVARTPDGAVPCPVCETPTGRVHGFHSRTVSDVAVDGRQGVVKVRLRRLVCPVGEGDVGSLGRRERRCGSQRRRVLSESRRERVERLSLGPVEGEPPVQHLAVKQPQVALVASASASSMP